MTLEIINEVISVHEGNLALIANSTKILRRFTLMSEENGIKSDESEELEFKAEIQQLLNIIGSSLYTNREIFLRELVSNSSDALNKIRFEELTNQDIVDAGTDLTIKITFDEEEGTITVSDTGIGMTKEEIIDNLGTIASSGTRRFLEAVKEGKEDVDLIGQFGVGFYSVFMVAKSVIVRSRSFMAESDSVEFISDGTGKYTLKQPKKQNRGTEVIVHLKEEDAKEFASKWRLESVIRKYSNFVQFPIYVGDAEEPVNQQTPLWRKA